MKEIEQEKETLMASNNSMAEFNLSKEPELVEGREKLQELSEEGELLTKNIEEKIKELSKQSYVLFVSLRDCMYLILLSFFKILYVKYLVLWYL